MLFNAWTANIFYITADIEKNNWRRTGGTASCYKSTDAIFSSIYKFPTIPRTMYKFVLLSILGNEHSPVW